MAMSVAAPPQPPLLRASAGYDPGEALIKEAKQRARRRRWSYGGAVVVVAITAVATFTVPGSPSSPNRVARNTPPASSPPTPLGAPLVKGPDAASTILTSWGAIHAGYVFVYADGRVLAYSDSGIPDGIGVNANGRVTVKGWRAHLRAWKKSGAVFQDAVIERRLSPRGLDLLRSGKLDPEYFLGLGLLHPYRRTQLWAEPTARIWEPSKYALCPNSTIPGDGSLSGVGSLAATDVIDELPPPVQALLADRQHTYNPSDGMHGTSGGPSPVSTECFEVTAAEAATLYQMLDANGQIFNKGHYPRDGWDGFFAYGRVNFSTTSVFPHGQFVVFGG
jgi:hypothetical protein